MRLQVISEGCQGGECPTVYVSEHGTVVFQGYVVTGVDGLTLSPGEEVVELPLEVVRSALTTLTALPGRA